MNLKFYFICFLYLLPLAVLAQFDKPEVFPFKYNSNQGEFGPTIVGDTLYFSKITQEEQGENLTKNPESFYRIRRVQLDGNGQPVSVVVSDTEKNSRFHDGPIAYSAATNTYFITRSAYNEAEVKNKVFKKRMVELKLDMYNTISKAVKPFPYNSNKYSVVHPALNKKGDVLIFSSDMPGGNGGNDLYISRFQEGQWSKPENLGSIINSDKNELYPFISTDNELYFTSDRSGGIGGQDIYMAKDRGNFNFATPALLGDPINTTYDDFGFSMADTKKFGVIASNRSGREDDDLYMLKLAAWTKEIEGLVVDKKTGSPLAGVTMNLFGPDSVLVEAIDSNNEGKFILNLEAEKAYYVRAEKATYETQEQPVNYFTENLLFRMSGVHEYRLTVLDVQSNRPVENFLARNLADGRVWSGVDDFVSIYLVADADNQIRIEAPEYFMQRVAVNTVGKPYGVTTDTVLIYPKKKDAIFELKNINYDYNSANLTPSSKIELNKLVSLMNENPDVLVNLRSHTDSRGSDEYNMTLSNKRSASCRQYLVEMGINPSRISARGYGETMLLNECGNGVNCPEEMHHANRRTEIKFDQYVSVGDKQKQIDDAIKASGKRFFLVSGSFKNEFAADSYYEDMKLKGYEVQQLGKIRGGYFGVAVEGYSSLIEARTRLEILNKDKEFNNAIWIYDFGKY
ncbi:MAG: OmpA family protein [Mangrovibacterium sp.]